MRRAQPRTGAGRTLLALVTLALLPACGHRGNPRPPLRRTPPAPTAFRLAQRGDQLQLQAQAPATSIDGVVYDSITVEFLHGTGQADLAKAGARKALRVRGGALALATLPLPAPGTLVRASARAVRGSETSPRTLTLALVAQPPIEAPRELVATLSGGGIDLNWLGARPKPIAPLPAPRVPGQLPAPARPAGPPTAASPLDASPTAPTAGTLPAPAPASAAPERQTPTPGEAPPSTILPAGPAPAGQQPEARGTTAAAPAPTPPRRSGFFLYRRPDGGVYDAPLNDEPLERRVFSDEEAPLGSISCYVVRAVGSSDPLIESASSNEVCLERRDITPPAPPAGLAVLPRQGGLELLWSPSSEEDLAGYRVWRSVAGAAPERLAELPPGKVSYLDEAVQKGVSYRYTLTAFDQAGNESAACEPAEATLP